MASNQTQIPVLQHPDALVTQVQQNVNKVLRNIGNQANQANIIGEIKLAELSETQFQSQAGVSWLLCNGQSCTGTSYAAKTGNSVVPTISPLAGADYFIRVN